MKTNVASIAETVDGKEVKLKTDKKVLKQVEKIIRDLDNALSDLNQVSIDLNNFHEGFPATEVDEKDINRLYELREVVQSTTIILYYLTNRMSRKYVGKEINSLEEHKRKALKKA